MFSEEAFRSEIWVQIRKCSSFLSFPDIQRVLEAPIGIVEEPKKFHTTFMEKV